MAVPKNQGLVEKEKAKPQSASIPYAISQSLGDAIEIRPVDCQNDFIAILQQQMQTSIMLADDTQSYKNEGLVIGVGPGVSDGAGGRLKPNIEVGDYVMFGSRNIVQEIVSNNGPYAMKKVVIVSERNIICKLPSQIKWKII